MKATGESIATGDTTATGQAIITGKLMATGQTEVPGAAARLFHSGGQIINLNLLIVIVINV